MSDWKHLPPEILSKIFIKLCKKDKGKSALTCRAWRSVAQPLLFEEFPCLADRDVNMISTILTNSKLKQSPGDYVKILYGYNFSEKFDVALLDKLFPFLESFDINPNQQALYDKLYQLIMEGKFSNLKKMAFIKMDEAYLKLLLAKKEQIKDLQVRDRPYNEKVIKEIFNNIRVFNKLKKLKLDCSHEKSIVCLESLFAKNLPALTIIEFAFRPPAKLILNMPVDLSVIQPLPSVREIRMENQQLFSEGGELYHYFMKKFPNVNKVYLSTDALQVQNYKVPSVACLSEFLLYLSNAKEGYSVRPIITNHITAQAIEKFLIQALDQKSGTIKKKEFQLQIAFDVTWEESDSNTDCTAYIGVSKTHTVIIDEHRGYHVTNKQSTLKVVYKYTLQNILAQPYLELFQRVGGMNVENLMIENSSWSSFTPQQVPVPLYIILDHFTNLKKLCLHEISNITSSDLNKLESTLEYLAFETCSLDQEIFHRISNRCSALRMLRISDCCRFIKHDEDTMLRIISINMPSTHIHDLCLAISLDVFDPRDYQYERVFIRLRTANGKKPRYCKLIWTSSPYWEEEPDDYTTEFDTREGGYTEDDFNMCVKDKECMVYDIYCESVTKLTVHNTAIYSYISEYETRVYLEEDL